MKTLAIETVTKTGSLALVENGRVTAEKIFDTRLNHAANLVPALDDLLKEVSIDIRDIDAIGVDIGPGSFTGIRVGLASAEGLAQAKGIPVIGVCSLDILCRQAVNDAVGKDTKYLSPFIDAKRGMIYSACYEIDGKNVHVRKKPYLTTAVQLTMELSNRSFVFGPDITMLYKDQNPVFPSAGIAGIIAEELFKSGNYERKVAPMYIHEVEYSKTEDRIRKTED